MSKYGVFSGPYFPVFSLNTGKDWSEKTPYWDTFHAVTWLHLSNKLSHINYKFRIYWYYSISTIQKERIWATISDKNNWDSLYFHKKVPKKTLDLLKVTQNPSSPWLNAPPSLKKPCEAAKTRNELPICNQHWIRGKGRRVLQFLSLPVSKIKIFLKRVF